MGPAGRMAIAAVGIATALATLLGGPTGAQQSSQPDIELPEFGPFSAAPLRARSSEVDRETVLVRLRQVGPNPARRLAGVGVRTMVRVPGTEWLALGTGGRAHAVRTRLAADPAVLEVVPNYRRRASTLPDDPLWETGQRRTLSPLRVDRAWDRSRGQGVIVAVLDSGVDFRHPDLRGRVIAPGLDLVSGGAADDDSGHGTMVSGIIVATRGNGRGIAGVAPGARILPVKVLDREGFAEDLDVAIGMAWAVERGADVINLSLGGVEDSPVLTAAVRNARARGVVVVAAAGNSGSGVVDVPARIPGVLAVSATTDDGRIAAFSSFGRSVGVAAPGYRVTSTALGRPAGSDTYSEGTGTSFAAPIVSGTVALVRARYPALPAGAVVSRILLTARDRGPAGVDPAFGHGVVDPLAALGGAAAASRAEFRPTPDSDAGELPGTAQVLPLGIARDARIAPETDEDWYRITFTPGSYRVAVPPRTGNPVQEMDALVDLYDPGLRFLASQVVGGGDLVFRIEVSGTYFVRVRNRNAGAVGYRLRVAAAATVPRFRPSTEISASTGVGSVAIADLTGDGRPDGVGLVGGSAPVPDTLLVVPQIDRRGFGLPRSTGLPPGVVGGSLAVGDLSGDGRSDVVLAASSGIVTLIQGASGRFIPRIRSIFGFSRFAVADIDGDGFADLVAAGPAGLRVLWGDAAGGLATSTFVTSLPASALAVDSEGGVLSVHTNALRYARLVGRDPASTSIPMTGARAAAFDPVRGEFAVSVGTATTGSISVLRPVPGPAPGLETVRVLAPVVADPGPVVVAPGGVSGSEIYSLSRATGMLGVVPAVGGPATRVTADPTGGVPYSSGALAVGDVDGDGAADALVASPTGMYVVRHGLSDLPAVYGRWLVAAAEPVARSVGLAGTVRPRLALVAPVSNPASSVRVVGRHGERISVVVAGLGSDRVTIVPSAPLRRGAYTLVVDGLLAAGGDRASGISIPFYVGSAPDRVAPVVAVTRRPVGLVPPLPTSIEFVIDDPTAVAACSIDNRPYVRCRSPLVLWLGSGRHSIRLLARDTVGNESLPAAATWTVGIP